MSQSKKASRVEVVCNQVFGYLIALLTWTVVSWVMEIDTSMTDNILITSIFTVVSMIRSYYMRRLFNYLHVKGVLK